ncbi:Piso0_003046 [Millerozyma farinosa CBS 7064]|uniref:Anaphase-promoting complex subunit 4 n=1 Tax=Pichia sorbitophila (strain ATCC MYA-4447 / BCRC 22081 / CBS 7064 / NBRC 10061 / NRRL Y-12695) TaxID=559304 RepID=G8YH16_PICSO|nr:Piso0_003046 [Millerozyma farinosa CBS 7064]CCE80718.1 Piso0_003046 [Millerozyma farinosa CBS 7064]
MDHESSSGFSLLTASRFMGIADGNILSWCPTMDLIAVSMNRMSVWVFRLTGERIYSVNTKSVIVSLVWNPSGKYFAVSGQDGLCKIYDSNSGQLINVVGTGEKIDLISWPEYNLSTNNYDLEGLFEVDTLSQLPRLSSYIDHTGADNSSAHLIAFQIDEINKSNVDKMDYLLSVQHGNSLSITFNSLFTVDNIKLPDGFTYLKHISNNDLFHQLFLVESDTKDYVGILEAEFKISDQDNLRSYFIKLLSYSCKILSIFNYIKDSLHYIVEEIRPYFQFFDRHLSNLKDSLYNEIDLTTHFPTEEESNRKIVTSFIDMLVTGLVDPQLKDYWTNQLSERGVKRLSKMGSALYETIRKVCFNRLIVALERLVVILNSIEGIVRWLEDFSIENGDDIINFGLSSKSISSCCEQIKALIEYLYRLICEINEEERLFNEFISWIKLGVIDKISKEDDLESYYESLQSSFKYSDLIEYLNNYLFSSKLFNYFEVELSSNEVILPQKTKHNVVVMYDSIESNLRSTLIGSFSSYIRSSLDLTKTYSFDVMPEITLSSIYSPESKGSSVLCLHEKPTNSLAIIKFTEGDMSFHILRRIKLTQDQSIIKTSLGQNSNLLMLVKDKDQYLLKLFNLDDLLSQDKKEIDYRELNSVKSIALQGYGEYSLTEPSHLAANQYGRQIACILDAKKRNYVVLEF